MNKGSHEITRTAKEIKLDRPVMHVGPHSGGFTRRQVGHVPRQVLTGPIRAVIVCLCQTHNHLKIPILYYKTQIKLIRLKNEQSYTCNIFIAIPFRLAKKYERMLADNLQVYITVLSLYQ